MENRYSSSELRDIGQRNNNRLPPASTVLGMFEYEMRRAAENESLFDNAMIQAAKSAKEVSNQHARLDSLESTVKACATHHDNERTISVPSVCAIVEGLNSFSPTDSDPKAVLKRTNWLANELDQEAISTEDQIALTAVLSATHIHEAKMDLQRAVQHLSDDYLTIHNDLLEALSRISKLEDLVRALTMQRASATDSPKLTQRMAVTSSNGQTLDLSVPKGKALVPLISSRTSSVTPSPTKSSTLDGEKTGTTTEERLLGTDHALKQFADDEKLRLRTAQEDKQTKATREKNVTLGDLSEFSENFSLRSGAPDDIVPILAVSDANEVEDKSTDEHASEPSDFVQATANVDQKLPENMFNRNDKPLPPVPAAHAFPDVDVNRNAALRKQPPPVVGAHPIAMAQKETVASATTAWDISKAPVTTSEPAKPIPTMAQTPKIVSPTHSKSKANKWKDPPLFQDTEATSAPAPFQFSVSALSNANGQLNCSNGHHNATQQSTDQTSQQPDLKPESSKGQTANDGVRHFGDVKKVLQDNKKLDGDKPSQNKSAKPPVFNSAAAMMNLMRSIAPNSSYVASSQATSAATSQTVVPRDTSTLPNAASQPVLPRGTFALTTAASQPAVLCAPSTLPTANPTSNNKTSQSSLLQVPVRSARKSAVKLVKPETELSSTSTALSPTISSPTKQKKSTEASPAVSTSGPSTPPALIITGVRDNTSPSTITSSSPLTPSPANKATMNADAPNFRPSPSTGPDSSSSTGPTPQKKQAVPDNLKKLLTPSMLASFSNILDRS